MPAGTSLTSSCSGRICPKKTDCVTLTKEASVSTEVMSATIVASRKPMFPLSTAFW